MELELSTYATPFLGVAARLLSLISVVWVARAAQLIGKELYFGGAPDGKLGLANVLSWGS